MKISDLKNQVLINQLLDDLDKGNTHVGQGKEKLHLCMRDTGFEFEYAGRSYSAQRGVLVESKRFVI